MPISKAQQKAVKKYNDKAYDEIKIRVRKGKKAVISDYTASQGKSINRFINDLIEQSIPNYNKDNKWSPKIEIHTILYS